MLHRFGLQMPQLPLYIAHIYLDKERAFFTRQRYNFFKHSKCVIYYFTDNYICFAPIFLLTTMMYEIDIVIYNTVKSGAMSAPLTLVLVVSQKVCNFRQI